MNMNNTATPTKRPQEVIQEKTRGEIDAYLSGRGKTRIHEGARNLSRNLSDEYGNRFLVELIQNAHDALEKQNRIGDRFHVGAKVGLISKPSAAARRFRAATLR
jgi:hypothetical protein